MPYLSLITAGPSSCDSILVQNLKNCQSLGIDLSVLDFGDLGWGRPTHVHQRELKHPDLNPAFPTSGLFKARLLFDAWEDAIQEDTYLTGWLDGDMVIRRPLFFPSNAAVYLTLRGLDELGKGPEESRYTNAGLIAVRCNTFYRADEFLVRFDELCRNSTSDQLVLNQIIDEARGEIPWSELYNRTIMHPKEFSIHLLHCDEWNSWKIRADESWPPEAKIVHYKTGIRPWFNAKKCEVLR